MNYKLAKKLKDAGFPQNSSDYYRRKYDSDRFTWAVAPTLSELIEACGDKFEHLERVVWTSHEPIHWRAYPTEEAFENTEGYKKYPCVIDCCGYGSGDTPEEAVAELWLDLNEHE